MHRCEVSDAAGVGVDRGRYDVVGKRGEKACRPRHKREESALNITELRSNDDDIQGRGAWSFQPPASCTHPASVVFEKCLITKRMQNGAEDRGTRKPSKCLESATPVLGLIAYILEYK